MKDERKTKKQLISELVTLRRQITDLKASGKELKQVEERYRSLIEKERDIIYTLDNKGRITFSSPAVENLLGYRPDEVVGKNFMVLIPEERQEKTVADFQNLLKTGELTAETVLLDKRGQPHFVEYSSTTIQEGGRVIGTRGIVRDITERKLAEEKEKRYLRGLKFLSETSTAFVEFPPEKDICCFIGEKLKELAGNSVVGVSLFDEETDRLCIRAVVGLGRRTNAVMKAMGGDPVGMSFKIDDRVKGHLAKGKLMKIPGGVHGLSPDIPKAVGSSLERTLNLGDTYAMGFTRDGKLFGNAVLLMQKKNELTNRGIVETFIRQASVALQHRHFENALGESEEKYRALVESATDFIYMIDKNNKVLSLNKSAARLFDKEPKDVVGKSLFELFPEEIATNYSKDLKKVFETGKPGFYEARMIFGSRELWISVSLSPVKNREGEIIGVMGITRDITERKLVEEELKEHRKHLEVLVKERTTELIKTNKRLREQIAERKQTEEALRKSEERFKQVVENAQEWIWEVDTQGLYTHASPIVEKILGYKPEEIVGKKHFYDLFHPEDREDLKKAALEAFEQKIPFRQFINRNVDRDGNTVWLATSGVPILDEDGNLIGYRGADTDVTERKQAEEALKKSEEKYRTLTENVNVGVYRNTVGPRGKFIEANPAIVEMFGYQSKEEFLGMNVADLYQHPEERKRFNEKMLGDGFVRDEELRLKKKDGTPFIGSVSAVAVMDEKGKVKYYDGVIEDITDRKKSEERLKASLKEKDVLLKEIHHRVKNNLQIISSLLSLQSRHMKDKDALDLFKESQDRVRSMALVHEKLYGSEDLAKIDFAEYVKDLSRWLCRSYGADSRGVALDVRVEKVSLGIDRAIPCGLVINELVSNALKYAFPPEWDGKSKVTVSLHRTEGNEVELAIKDNGVGLPENLDIRKTESLGLHLVVLLAEDQLEGKVRVERKKGTTFRITFKGDRG